MVLLQLKDPLELFVKRREFLPGSAFLSRHGITYDIEIDVKPNFSFPYCAARSMTAEVCLSRTPA